MKLKNKSSKLASLEKIIKEKEAQKVILKNEILSLWEEYAKEKHKDIKVGHIYTYNDSRKPIKGVISIQINPEMPSLYPLRLQVINKDGKLGNTSRIVYNTDFLVYEGEYK